MFLFEYLFIFGAYISRALKQICNIYSRHLLPAFIANDMIPDIII